MADRRQERLEQLAILRKVERLTFAECAARMGMSERQLRRWAQEPDFEDVLRNLHEEWREASKAAVTSLGWDAIAVLKDLMLNARREDVRFQSAKAIAEFAGIGRDEREELEDDREALGELVELIKKRQLESGAPGVTNVNVTLPPGSTIRLPEGQHDRREDQREEDEAYPQLQGLGEDVVEGTARCAEEKEGDD